MCKNCLKNELHLNCIRITDISLQISELIQSIKNKYDSKISIVNEELSIIEKLNSDIGEEIISIRNKIDNSEYIKRGH
jgi:hypothetical protein